MRLISYLTIFTGILLIFSHFHANAADITCADGSCSFDPLLDVRNDSNTPEFSQFEVKDLSEQLNIAAPAGSSPRSTKVYIETIDPDGENLLLSLPSLKKLNPAGSAIVISQAIKDLSVNLDGRPGDGTPSASSVCATKILNGDYGAPVKSRFLLARFNDPSLPTNLCVPSDLSTIQSNEFSCAAGQSEFSGVSLPASRWTQRRTCDSLSDRRMCLKRKMKIQCTWVAERFTAGSGGCDESVPGGNGTLNPKPRGHGFNGKPWVCDPSIVSATASGWKIVLDPYVRDESYVQSRRLAGKTDENICDELTGRDSSYFLQYPDIYQGFARQGSTTFAWFDSAMNTANNSMSVDRIYWLGKSSKSTFGNSVPNESAPVNTIMISGQFRACYSAGSHSYIHTQLAVNTRNCRPWTNGVLQEWTGYTRWGGKGHTFRFPYALNCSQDPANNRFVCYYPLVGEAFSTVHQLYFYLYGPNGRKFHYYLTKGIGRY